MILFCFTTVSCIAICTEEMNRSKKFYSYASFCRDVRKRRNKYLCAIKDLQLKPAREYNLDASSEAQDNIFCGSEMHLTDCYHDTFMDKGAILHLNCTVNATGLGDSIASPQSLNQSFTGLDGVDDAMSLDNPFVDSFDEFSDIDTSDSDGELNESCNNSLKSALAEWAVKFKVTHTAITALLVILHFYFPFLPRDSRTLLTTNVKCIVREMGRSGQYCHIGLAAGIVDLVTECTFSFKQTLSRLLLQINVDGLPLFKSSSTVFWPILCWVMNISFARPFLVGLYCGKEKLSNASEFLKEFVAEAGYLVAEGICIENKNYTVEIHSFVCDAPARAFVKGIKCHSGYNSCEKCVQSGEYRGRIIFPLSDSPLRTDQSFSQMTDERHHVQPCSVRDLNIGCVTRFGLDYMHLVCLGVVRRLLLYWKGPVGPYNVRLSSRVLASLSEKLLNVASYMPAEFTRRPRTVAEVKRWKATEFRQFLLYVGPCILNDILEKAVYNHFMLLSVAIRILASPHLPLDHAKYANELLVLFVNEGAKIYGKEFLVYNVHSLVHLTNDVINLGPLEDFSAFKYENVLGMIKRLVRKPQYPMQQVVRRLREIHMHHKEGMVNSSSGVSEVLLKEHCEGPVPNGVVLVKQFRKLQFGNYVISTCTRGNNYLITNDYIPVIVRNIGTVNNETVLICSTFLDVRDAFDYPIQSSKLGIYRITESTSTLKVLALKDIKSKCVYIAISDRHSILVPLLH